MIKILIGINIAIVAVVFGLALYAIHAMFKDPPRKEGDKDRHPRPYIFYFPRRKEAEQAFVYTDEEFKALCVHSLKGLASSLEKRKLPRFEEVVEVLELVRQGVDYGIRVFEAPSIQGYLFELAGRLKALLPFIPNMVPHKTPEETCSAYVGALLGALKENEEVYRKRDTRLYREVTDG